MTELKPCPFCGGEAELATSNINENCRTFFRVRCQEDECIARDVGFWILTPEEAAEAWNTRSKRTCGNVREPNQFFARDGAILGKRRRIRKE